MYSHDNSTEQQDEDSDRHYAQLLYLYGDADEWVRKQQQDSQQSRNNTVKLHRNKKEKTDKEIFIDFFSLFIMKNNG